MKKEIQLHLKKKSITKYNKNNLKSRARHKESI